MKTRYFNGKIYLGEGRYCDTFVVDEDRFISLCDSEEEPVDTEVDLRGLLVLPGFIDSHLHVYGTGKRLSFCDLREIKSIAELIQKKEQWLEKNTSGVIIGYNWNQDHFKEKRMPTKEDLDQISTDIPIIFGRVCGHILVANNKAFELAGITEQTPVPEGGDMDFEKGILMENAQDLIKGLYPELTLENAITYYQLGIEHCLAHGITTALSNDISVPSGGKPFEAINHIFENKRPMRIIHKISTEDPELLDDFLKSKRNQSDIHHFGPIKLFKDGTLGARTSLLKGTYADLPEAKGVDTLSQEELKKMLRYGEESGRNVMVHAIGDAAISEVLDAYEEIMPAGNPLRHAIVHAQITSDEELERGARLKVPFLYQPIFLDYDLHIVKERVGADLAASSYAFKTYKELGGIMAFGSDAPVDSIDPFSGMQCAVTRKDLSGEPQEGYRPEEALTLEECIEAYTKTSAYVCGLEGVTGEIKEGMKADFIILEDLFKKPIDELKNTEVLATYFDGKLVYGGL